MGLVQGDIAQLVERGNRTAEVRSSSLLISTRISYAISSFGFRGRDYLANRKEVWYSCRYRT